MKFPKLQFSVRTLLLAITCTGIGIVGWPTLWTHWAVRSVARSVDRDGDFVRPAADRLVSYGNRSIPAFVELLRHEDIYVRMVAAEKLGELEPSQISVKALVRALHDKEQRVRVTAVHTFWKMEALAEPFLDELANCLLDESPRVRLSAIHSLGSLANENVNTTSAIPAMLKLAQAEPIYSSVIASSLKEMQASSIDELSQAAGEALANLSFE